MSSKRKTSLSGLFLFFVCIFRNVAWSQKIIEVNTTSGLIQGMTFNSVNEFLGVPYAQPPIDHLRFKAPVPVIPSSDVYPAIRHKSACMQNQVLLATIISRAIGKTTDESPSFIGSVMDEDCLYLDIYSPASSSARLLPVMVFIHGGSFTSGTGAIYNGEKLASDYDVLVVVFNYRLGAFGFLFGENDDIEGNFGILDQKMALEWIKENIEGFGGDRDAITIFGEEVGGSSAHIHLLGAENDLFKNVIIQSAQYEDGVWSERQCTDRYKSFISELGYEANSDLSELLRNETSGSLIQSISDSLGEWRPCNLSNILRDFPSVLMKQEDFLSNESNDQISVLCGTNLGVGQEQTFDVSVDTWLYDVTNYTVTTSFPQLYGEIDSDLTNSMSKNYLQFYGGYDFDETETLPIERNGFASNTFGDQYYKTWAQEISQATNKLNSTTYKYVFTEEIATQGGQASIAGLSDELPYIFGFQLNLGANAVLTTIMMTYWTNFAKTGNPNLPNNPLGADWPLYEANSISDSSCRNLIELNSMETFTSSDNTASRTWEFWTIYYELLELSCTMNETTVPNPNEEETTAPICEPSVQDAIGMAVSNEDAAIMLIVFIAFTGVFLMTSLITSFCCWRYKKKFQRQKKKNKKERGGHDNPNSSSESKF